MDPNEQVDKFQEFIEAQYLADLHENVRRGDFVLHMDFTELAKFDPALADILLDEPENTFEACQTAIARMGVSEKAKIVHCRFFNLPESQYVNLRDIRSKHLGKFLQVEGIVRQKSDVRPQVTSARFECPSCGNIINVLQLDTKFKEPSACGCGRKGKFRLVSKELVDAQKIVLEEAPEDLDGGEQPKRLNIFLKNDLVSPMTEKRTNPGSRVKITGIIKEVPIPSPEGGNLTRFDLIDEANHIVPVQDDFLTMKISDEELQKIKDLGNNPRVLTMLTESIAPGIYGHDKVKEALVLQLLSGVRKVREDGSITRGDIHILLIGDPGSGKSQLLRRAAFVAPKSRFVSGKGASGAGLTAAVVKDDFLKGYALEAGALVLANNGLCCLDELDKMGKDDRSAMHEALEQQTVSIAKANIQATLRCVTTVLAAANPKWGRFDPYEVLAKQIDLPSTLINRFDLIFPIRDLPDVDKDTKMASFILKLHQDVNEMKSELDTNLIRKYIAYCKRHSKPRLTDSALKEIKEYYVKMRTGSTDDGGEGIKAIPISARQLEALVRLTEASAKSRLDDKATRRDARRAIDLVDYCLREVSTDPATGKLDIDRITTGISASTRSHFAVVRDLINELVDKVGEAVPEEDIMREAKEKGLSEETVDDIVNKMVQKGDLFRPKRGFISRIK
ncbi:MAG: minichromosome maintenance protein MCM [Nanoarchaeota archaeon]